ALLVRDGLTPVQALAAATSVPAQAFHLSDRGWIRPGMRADLVLVEGDPTTNILATRNIVAAWKRGIRAQREGRMGLGPAARPVFVPCSIPSLGQTSANSPDCSPATVRPQV